MSNRRIVLSGGPWREIDRLNERIAELEAKLQAWDEVRVLDPEERRTFRAMQARIEKLEAIIREHWSPEQAEIILGQDNL